jgi:glycosyltransferase involved in cell wall biosynthesis
MRADITEGMRVVVVIPALDEAASIGRVVVDIAEAVRAAGHDALVLVADNGSSDETAVVARNAGARVVVERERGYGAACLRALAELPSLASDVDVALFADGDGADDPADVAALLAPLARGRADLVIGSRSLGERLGLVEPHSLTRVQRFGNALATSLLRLALGHSASDLGPFRAVTTSALAQIAMDDRGFGWTVQMQARAARLHLRVVEVPVRYRRRRTGRSKVSGDVRASIAAGVVILTTIAREAFRRR